MGLNFKSMRGSKTSHWMDPKTCRDYDRFLRDTQPPKNGGSPKEVVERHEVAWGKQGGLSLLVVMTNMAKQRNFPLVQGIVCESDRDNLAVWLAKLLYGREYQDYLLTIQRAIQDLNPGSKAVLRPGAAAVIEDI